MNLYIKIFLLLSIVVASSNLGIAQEFRWLDVGSFHNFYSSVGIENEQGFIHEQQAGWQWPAIYRSQDAQNWKSLWLGVTDFTDENGNNYPVRVAHAGPRISGLGQFFPMEFETRSKFVPTLVTVDATPSEGKTIINDIVDPTMKADREIYTRVNTLIGIQVERTIKQFSQQYHDNYHIIEYVFTNTGNTDDDDDIELPDQTINGFVPYFTNRMAPVQATRYVIGNDTGWGRNTMIDRRGDGQQPGETEDFRAHYAWHGYWQQEVDYDNIGGPIFVPNTSRNYLSADDTTGRLAAYHFLGTVTIHADTSPDDPTDDPEQPFTMTEIHSDDNLLFPPNDAFSVNAMTDEYEIMTEGRTPRHAYRVEPEGDEGFLEPSTHPNLGNSGGFSYAYSYGPYTLQPGESVTIVIADASSGISRELADKTGAAFKAGDISTSEKNEIVFQGRDSLFQTFERAITNYDSDYAIPSGPLPPSEFDIESTDDGVHLAWEYDGEENNIEGFEIYRTHTELDSAYYLVYKAEANEREIFDNDDFRAANPDKFHSTTPEILGYYYYYIVTIDKNKNTDDTGNTPIGSKLRSNRYYTQTYRPIRPVGGVSNEEGLNSASKIKLFQNYPNPFNPRTTISYYLPKAGNLEIAVYNIMGQKIATLFKGLRSEGMHEVVWDAGNTASGVYFYQLKMDKVELSKQFILLK